MISPNSDAVFIQVAPKTRVMLEPPKGRRREEEKARTRALHIFELPQSLYVIRRMMAGIDSGLRLWEVRCPEFSEIE
jgi:hypothetical protein